MYFIIPTINGEISGEHYITYSLDYEFLEEVIIYKINIECLVEEVKY